MPTTTDPTWSFALVVVRHDDEFLVVNDRTSPWWQLPSGDVEPGQDLAEVAVARTLEMTGERVELTGVLRIEHDPLAADASAMRVIFTARGTRSFFAEPDIEPPVLETRWASLGELDELELRNDEARDIFEYVARSAGGPFPMALLRDGDSWVPWTPREVV